MMPQKAQFFSTERAEREKAAARSLSGCVHHYRKATLGGTDATAILHESPPEMIMAIKK
jgi:hypothetical protein